MWCIATRVVPRRTAKEDSTYQASQYVDFVKEHSLLLVVHVALSEHLHCSLGASVSVHTHSDLSECAYIHTRSLERMLVAMSCLPLPSIFPIL